MPKQMNTSELRLASSWMNCWFLLSFQLFGACANQCKPPTNSEPRYLKNNVMTLLQGLGAEGCIRTCLQTQGCRSVNLHMKRDICELNSANKNDFPEDMVEKPGFVYIANSLVPARIPIRSCAVLKKLKPTLKSGYYSIETKRKKLRVYCDMDKFGGGWTLVVSISASDNLHLMREKNCADSDMCVPFPGIEDIPARKHEDVDIQDIASFDEGVIAAEGVFRVETTYSPHSPTNKNASNVFYKIPSGGQYFDSYCRAVKGSGVRCPRIIISYHHPFVWESSPCTGIEKGYRITFKEHTMFDGADDRECGEFWMSSAYSEDRMLYGLPWTPNHTGILQKRQGFLWIK
ncbi:uncharacterized protein LOC5520471 isoform X1 [Nematostella vectensis]|uniref:uncharacterized protein LOC5520471 isoform X1 n=1 Tax=Nematostella vectensis TaxID=45351 RepID=UPI0020777A34|nr:uncharacterized protein LOC5520471 isoform X1 [Nematostella vectensis]